jgi:hypothetical protein
MASTIKSGSNNDLYIQTDGVDRIVVDSNGNTSVTGNVGIGTASPTVPLHVTDSGTFIGGIESTTAYAYLGLRDLNSGGSMADPTVGVGAQTNDLAFRAGGAERVRIDANGYVTMPYQPALSAVVTSSQAVGASTSISFNSILFNRQSQISASLSNSRFTVPVTGYYRVSLSWFLTAGFYDSALDIRVNGTGKYRIGQNLGGMTGTPNNVGNGGGGLLDLGANDYIEIFASGSKTILGSGAPYHSNISISFLG